MKFCYDISGDVERLYVRLTMNILICGLMIIEMAVCLCELTVAAMRCRCDADAGYITLRHCHDI